MSFYDLVYDVVCKIPSGKVMTYGQVAALCGSPKASRAVGYALHVNPRPGVIPCHRIVNRHGYLSGGFAFGGIDVQKNMLQQEGVFVDLEYRVNLENYLYNEAKMFTAPNL